MNKSLRIIVNRLFNKPFIINLSYKYHIVLLLFLVLFGVNISVAQTQETPEIASSQTSSVDSSTVAADTSVAIRNTFKEIFRGKPGKAAFYSLIIPGGGQIYNKKWLKLPLTYAIEGGAAAWLIYNSSEFRYYDNIFDNLVKGNGDPSGRFNSAREVKPIRDSFRKKTEYAWVFMILAHLYNVFDAYVDRHLMDFDISEDISIQVFPPPTPQSYAALGIGYRF